MRNRTAPRALLAAVAALLTTGGCGAQERPPGEVLGSWRLAAVCLYESPEGPPCEAVPTETAQVLTLGPDLRFTRVRPDEEGRYRLERRTTPAGTEELLIRFDGGTPAQLVTRGDTLVVSWAYVDGPENRYARER